MEKLAIKIAGFLLMINGYENATGNALLIPPGGTGGSFIFYISTKCKVKADQREEHQDVS